MAKISNLIIGKDRSVVLMQTQHSPLIIRLETIAKPRTKQQLTFEEMTQQFYDICSLIIVVLVRNTSSLYIEYHS